MLKKTLACGIMVALLVGCEADPEPNRYARKCLKTETESSLQCYPGQVGGISVGGSCRMHYNTVCAKYSDWYETQAWYDWNERQKLKPKKD